ncbi:hypothetical protein [Rubrivirga sp.]|uniref:hypothetical protein n=1 Tax=Rubrivirga sp. TaxID=1885344 RepID=UPI003C757A90
MAATSVPVEEAAVAIEVSETIEVERAQGRVAPAADVARRASALVDPADRAAADLDAEPPPRVLEDDAEPSRQEADRSRPRPEVPRTIEPASRPPLSSSIALDTPTVLEVSGSPAVMVEPTPVDASATVAESPGQALGSTFDSAPTTALRPSAPVPSRLAVSAWLDRIPTDGQVRVSLGEDGSIHLQTSNDADGTTVSVRFSDPELQALAAAHAPRLRELLESHFEGAVRLSLDSSGADANTEGQTRDGSPDRPSRPDSGLVTTTDSPRPRPAVAQNGREWIG